MHMVRACGVMRCNPVVGEEGQLLLDVFLSQHPASAHLSQLNCCWGWALSMACQGVAGSPPSWPRTAACWPVWPGGPGAACRSFLISIDLCPLTMRS